MAAEPKLVIVEDAAAMSSAAADRVVEVLAKHPEAAISVPTGSTPVGMFEELIARQDRGEVDLARPQFFCLDEYLGLTEADPNSLTGWLTGVFLGPARIPADHVHTLPTTALDLVAAAASYERAIQDAGGLELAVLGLGPNGHIAYNEPGSLADTRTRVVDLTPGSVAQAAGYFAGKTVPSQAMTVGVGTLLEARDIVLIVTGAAKAEILRKALRDPMSAEVPASWLRVVPEKVTVIADRAAASLL